MEKSTKIKGLAVFGIIVLSLLGGKVALAQSSQGFIPMVAKLVAQEIVQRLEALGALDVGTSSIVESALGSAQTPASFATAASVTNLGGLFLWDTESNSGLEVRGNTTLTGTSTILVTANQQYFISTSFNAASTTLVSTRYTGPTVAVDSVFLDVDAGTSANTANSAFRAYVSKATADNSVNATGTLMRQVIIASSSLQVAYGGPVLSSYYTSSSAQLTALAGITTTTPIMLYNGDWINVTSTAITSSTGKIRLLLHQF